MVIHVREDYGDDWDDHQYKEWVDENIGKKVEKNWALVLAAVSEKFPKATLDEHADWDIDVLFDKHGRDYTDTKVHVDERRKLHIPVDFDPYEDDDACDSVCSTVEALLGDIKLEKGRQDRSSLGELENPLISFDDIDFKHDEITLPLEFAYDYHYEDSLY